MGRMLEEWPWAGRYKQLAYCEAQLEEMDALAVKAKRGLGLFIQWFGALWN